MFHGYSQSSSGLKYEEGKARKLEKQKRLKKTGSTNINIPTEMMVLAQTSSSARYIY
jgi:hypothetical protein